MQRNRHTLCALHSHQWNSLSSIIELLLGVVNLVSNISLFSDINIRIKKLHIRTRALQSWTFFDATNYGIYTIMF